MAAQAAIPQREKDTYEARWLARARVGDQAVRGFRAGAMPVVCVLLMIYGALVLGTVRQGQAIDDGLRQMVQHEGRYYTSLAGNRGPRG